MTQKPERVVLDSGEFIELRDMVDVVDGRPRLELRIGGPGMSGGEWTIARVLPGPDELGRIRKLLTLTPAQKRRWQDRGHQVNRRCTCWYDDPCWHCTSREALDRD